MANARPHVDTVAHFSVSLLTKKLAEARAMLLIQQRAITEGRIDSLEASVNAMRDVIEQLAACKRVCQASAGDETASSESGASSVTAALVRLEEEVAELILLQQQNRALLVERMERSAALLDAVHHRHVDIPSRSFPDQARNILINSEI